MKLSLQKVSSTILLAVVSAILLSVSADFVLAQSQGLIESGDNPQLIGQATNFSGSIRQLALTMINFFLSFLGFAAVIFVIYGGIQYVTAGGQQDKVDTAKKILMYSAAGLIIVLISFALVNTLLSAGTGTEPVA